MTNSFTNSILIFLAITSYGTGTEWNAFLGTFTSSVFGGGYYDMPFTKEEALASDPPYYDTGVQDPEFNVTIFCLDKDPHVCPLFDKNDKVAGLRISHIKSELSNSTSKLPYNFSEVSCFNESSDFIGYKVWYTTILFTNPVNLEEGGHGKNTSDETADGLWVRLDEGWTEIPRNECEAQTNGWKKQGFVTWMGNHYTRGKFDDCSRYLPLIPLYHGGRLISLAVAPLGNKSVITRDWLEDVPADYIKTIVPDGYEPCLQEWVSKYKCSSFHFYFIKHPRLILWDQSASC